MGACWNLCNEPTHSPKRLVLEHQQALVTQNAEQELGGLDLQVAPGGAYSTIHCPMALPVFAFRSINVPQSSCVYVKGQIAYDASPERQNSTGRSKVGLSKQDGTPAGQLQALGPKLKAEVFDST